MDAGNGWDTFGQMDMVNFGLKEPTITHIEFLFLSQEEIFLMDMK